MQKYFTVISLLFCNTTMWCIPVNVVCDIPQMISVLNLSSIIKLYLTMDKTNLSGDRNLYVNLFLPQKIQCCLLKTWESKQSNYSHLRCENDDDVVDNNYYHRNLIIPAQLIAIKTQGKKSVFYNINETI